MRFLIDKRGIPLLLAGVCFLAYANSLGATFLVDDIPAIVHNPRLSNPGLFLFSPAELLNSIDYLMGGLAPFAYHLTSVILHWINTVLVFYFLGLFFGVAASLSGAILFAVHPVHTEAVAWVSGRPYILISLFSLGVYLLYRRSSNKGAPGLCPYLLSVGIFSYFAIANYQALLVPVFIMVSDVIFGTWRKNFKRWIPYIIIAAAVFFLMKQAPLAERVHHMVEDVGYHVPKNPFVYFSYALYAYGLLLVWPAKLTLFHEPVNIPDVIFHYSIVCVILTAAMMYILFKTSRRLFFASVIFLLFLSPTFSPVPVSSLVAERYLYFPSVALCMGLAFLHEQVAAAGRWRRYAAAAAGVVVVTACLVRTAARNSDYASSLRFWEQSYAVSPDSWQVRNNLGFAYLVGGDPAKASIFLKLAIALNPGSADTYNNLGIAYFKSGDDISAIGSFKKALALDPAHANAHLNLGVISVKAGRNQEGIAYLEKELELNPASGSAHAWLCQAFYNSNDFPKAVRHCDEATRSGYAIDDELRSAVEKHRALPER